MHILCGGSRNRINANDFDHADNQETMRLLETAAGNYVQHNTVCRPDGQILINDWNPTGGNVISDNIPLAT